MSLLCQKIQENLQCLPPKDKELCEKFFKTRDFESLYSIVKSCLIMKRRDDNKDTHKEKWINVDRDKLEQLTLDIGEYLSYLDISDFNNDLEEEY